MLELLLILLLSFMLGGVAVGNWMVFSDPNSKLFTLGKKIGTHNHSICTKHIGISPDV